MLDGSILKDMEETLTKARQKCEVYSRVVGYLTPTSQWNDSKQSEWSERKVFLADCECDK